jgi:hypothetical protein
MPDTLDTGSLEGAPPGAPRDDIVRDAISIVQRGNLKALETTLRRQWRTGQNIVLCWSADERGVLVILVPHYFLGNYCAVADGPERSEQNNEGFIRALISGVRRKTREELFSISKRLDVAPTFIKLETRLAEEPPVIDAVEQIIRRYGLSYVDSRAVLLFDIVDFSLHTPFEQASQLNSLSYSLNSAYNKLSAQGVEVNFSRTTTGDGYYIWNRDLGAHANRDLFLFMLLVVADNAVARAASKGNTAPVVRTGYHIGGHYEMYLAEGVNPSGFSYIVGDVTIELARMLDRALPSQVLIGEFHCEQAGQPASKSESIAPVSAEIFINACSLGLASFRGIPLSGKGIQNIACGLTEGVETDGQRRPRRFRVVDKHGLSRFVYNLQIDIALEGAELHLGLPESELPGGREFSAGEMDLVDTVQSTAELVDDLTDMFGKKKPKTIVEE